MIDLNEIFPEHKKLNNPRICDSEQDIEIMDKMNEKLRKAYRRFTILSNESYNKAKDIILD